METPTIPNNDRLGHAIDHCEQLASDRFAKASNVYFMQAGEFVKVGVAVDVRARMSMIQTGCPYTVKLLHSFPTDNPYADEEALHHDLQRYHFRGEWFMLPQAVIELIASGFLYKSSPRRTEFYPK